EVVSDAAGERSERFELLRMQEPTLELAFALLGQSQRRDVLECPITAQALRILVEYDGALASHDPLATVCAEDAVFERAHHFPGELTIAVMLENLAILGMDQRDQCVAARRGVGRLEAEDVIELVGPVGHVGADIVFETADGGETLRPRQLLVAAVERDFVAPDFRDTPELKGTDRHNDQR